MDKKQKLRLDQLLVERHGYETRSRARDAILRGCVFVEDKKASKPGQMLPVGVDISIKDDASGYVSRAALKLLHAFEISKFNIEGKIALDLGASTGGFTQVLLEKGAKHVFAIDVGTGQLHPSLSGNSKITNVENLNARDLALEHLDQQRPEVLVSDLSFISLKLALPKALEIAADHAMGLFLIKPQFEVGKKGLGSGGIVRDPALLAHTIEDLGEWLNKQSGWQLHSIVPSPIVGGDGNHEFLMIGRKAASNE
jgi:23S rRNA (cytidine1920-2'-O)/16S rRNA (cytidine1409-2'-O)-methyltransferase